MTQFKMEKTENVSFSKKKKKNYINIKTKEKRMS